MTTPTQANIEAAARAIYEASGRTKDWQEIAAAALTAAAEAEGIKLLPEPELPAGHTPEWHIIDATIERCAQVAEDILGPEPMPNGFDVPAAIRALKEQT